MLSLSFLNEIHFNVDIFAFHIAAKCCHYENESDFNASRIRVLKPALRFRSALSHMDSSMCSSAPDPEMWIIQGTLAWRTSPVRTGV